MENLPNSSLCFSGHKHVQYQFSKELAHPENNFQFFKVMTRFLNYECFV